MATLHLTVNQPVTHSFAASSCGNYVWNGQTYTQSGTYTQTFTATNGCDSVATLHLTVNQPVTHSFAASSCGNYVWNGQTYTQSGTYTQTFTAANGCDSVVTLNLTVNQPVTNSISVSACGGHVWNGQTYVQSGTYTQTFAAANGCDSVVTLNLTIETVSTPVLSDVQVYGITAHTANVTASVQSDGCSTVLSQGFCWGTQPNPVMTGSHADCPTGMAMFFNALSGLEAGQTYYVRAYATNAAGTGYSTQATFTTDSYLSFTLLVDTPCTSNSTPASHSTDMLEYCVGTDSVRLSIGNYEYGIVQWQVSRDTVEWTDIKDANDTFYVFYPEESGYYRARMTYALCPSEYSQTVHLHLVPRADAGRDRVLNADQPAQLFGNEFEDATGLWTVLSGDSAVIDDPTDPYALFEGPDSLYVLTWTLTNSCGSSTDTVTMRFIHTVLADHIVVVDTTDLILSDSVELANGIYRIVFNYPVPTIVDSTILVGIPNGGFLRKVMAFEQMGDTVEMYTIQATLYDLIEEGAFNFDGSVLQTGGNTPSKGSKTVKGYARLDHQPTRAELMENPDFQNGSKWCYEYPMELGFSDGSKSVVRNFSWPIVNNDALSIMPKFSISEISVNPTFTPVFDFYKSNGMYYVSFSNKAQILFSFKATLDASISGTYTIESDTLDKQAEWSKTLTEIVQRYICPVGAVPVEIAIKFEVKFDLDASATITAQKTWKVSGALEYDQDLHCDDGNVSSSSSKSLKNFKVQDLSVVSIDGDHPIYNANINLGLELATSLKAKVSLDVYEVLGPYAEIGAKLSLKSCASLNPNTPSFGSISSELCFDIPWKLGLAMKVLKKKVFDINLKGKIPILKLKDPSRLERNVVPLQFYNCGNGVYHPGSFKVIGGPVSFFTKNKVHIQSSSGYIASSMYGNPGNHLWNKTVIDTLINSGSDFNIYWKPNGATSSNIKVEIKDCEGEDIDYSPMIFPATTGTSSCLNSTLQLTVVGGELRASGGSTSASTPYFYSSDGTTFSQTKPTPLPGHTYYVRDANNCVAQCHIPEQVCDLQLSYQMNGTTVVAQAANGTPPYRFYLDGSSTPFATGNSPTATTATLSYGEHTIRVRDHKGCWATAQFTITDGTYPPMLYVNPTYNSHTNTYTEVMSVVFDDGNLDVTECGIYYSTNPNMTPATKVVGSLGQSMVTYLCSVPASVAQNPYYVRAYAVNSKGTGYSAVTEISQQGGSPPSSTLPTVTTTPVTDMSFDMAQGGGHVSSDGGATVTVRGVCWSTSHNPTINNEYTTDGSGTGTFISTLTGLSAGTTYYIRAYATNSEGTAYGNEVIFTKSGSIPVSLPTVTTSAVTDMSYDMAQGGGNVTSDGGATVTVRGICWSTSHNPTINNEYTTDGGGTGSFISTLTGLSSGVTYYVRAYATNSAGTAYGSEVSFTKPGGVAVTLPTVTTTPVTDMSYDMAQGGGNVTSDGGATVTVRGVCWSTSHNPTTNNEYTTDGGGTGSFISTLTGLSSGVTYYVRAYATNSAGTAYGSEVSFTKPIIVPAIGYNSFATCDSWIYDNGDASGNYQDSSDGYLVVDPAVEGQGIALEGTYSTESDYDFIYVYSGAGTSGTLLGEFSGSGTISLTNNGTVTIRFVSDGSVDDSGFAIHVTCCTAVLPVVTTKIVTHVNSSSAICGGNVDAGCSTVTAKGVCWSTSPNPTISDSHTVDGNGAGEFASTINGLTEGAIYYVRAYAANSVGIAYGEEVSFRTHMPCPGMPTVTDHEGNVYNTIQIGDQCWMKENLRTTTSPTTGTYLIPVAGTVSTYTGKQARWYNNDSATYAPMNYGLLYNWNAAVDTFNTAYGEISVNTSSSNAVSMTFTDYRRGICPVGWHLPSNAEWMAMADYVGSQIEYVCDGNHDFIAKALASSEYWNSCSGECCPGDQSQYSNNFTGFSVVPAGGFDGSSFIYAGNQTYFWSSLQYENGEAYYQYLRNNFAYAFINNYTVNLKLKGFSVRCLRDTGIVGGDDVASLPSVITSAVSSISATSATCGGNVTSDGGLTLTERGICWSTSPNPTIADNHTSEGGGTGEFTSSITGLIEGSTYYVRAYATNSEGTAYGEEVSFIAENIVPKTGNSSITTCDSWIYDNGGSTGDYQNSSDGYLVVNPVSEGQEVVLEGTYTVESNYDHVYIYSGEGTSGTLLGDYTGSDSIYLTNNGTVTIRFTSDGSVFESGFAIHATCISLPTVITSLVTSITDTSATCGGNVTSDGGDTVTARGVCWSTSPNPTIADNHTSEGNGVGEFISTITGLIDGNIYYVRAYATNSMGTAYGNEVSFIKLAEGHTPCPNTPTVTDYDGNVYNTVQIGQQCWMKENLRTTHTSDGMPIPSGGSSHLTSQTAPYYYDNSGTNIPLTERGYLYNWPAAMVACPNGWHLPSDAEWLTLEQTQTTLDVTGTGWRGDIAGRLSGGDQWNSSSVEKAPGNMNYTDRNTSGFSAVPIGSFSGASSSFLWTGEYAFYWTSSVCNEVGDYCVVNEALNRYLNYNNAAVFRATGGLKSGFSVRCLRDTNNTGSGSAAYDGQPCPGTPTVTDYDGNVYNTVQLGLQCWMKENLRATHYADGTGIPVGDSLSFDFPYRYAPDNDEDKVPTYGYLYNWSAVMHDDSSSSTNPSGAQGICPSGWHVPSVAEWTQMMDYVGSVPAYLCNGNSGNIAKALAVTDGWESSAGDICTVGANPASNNASGFSIVPAGEYIGDYFEMGRYAFLWSSTESDSGNAWHFDIDFSSSNVYGYSWCKFDGYSVRCVLDGETPPSGMPTVKTGAVSSVTSNSATCEGEVIAEGSSPVSSRGICWSISPNPTISDNHLDSGGGIGTFSITISSVDTGVTYYLRAYATNSIGTAYGNQKSFTIATVPGVADGGQPCPGIETIVDVDGNVYNTVQIGSQCWMKENLRARHYANGDSILEVVLDPPVPTTGPGVLEPGGFGPCLFHVDNNSSNDTMYGLLYNWPAAMRSSDSSSSNPSGVQGACPYGWHVPSVAEWTQLLDFVSGESQYLCGNNGDFVAKSLSGEAGWTNSPEICAVGNNIEANNATGFSAIPAGYTTNMEWGVGSYHEFGDMAGYWSTTRYICEDCTDPWYMHSNIIPNSYYFSVAYNRPSANIQEISNNCGLSVRCLRSDKPTVTTGSVTGVSDTSATCAGNVTDGGTSAVTACGVCWSTSPNPTLADSHTDEGGGVGEFTSMITGLIEEVTYYVRAYATNSAGTTYGEEQMFTMPYSFQGEIVVTFNGSTWAAANMLAYDYTDEGYLNVIIEKTPGCSSTSSDIFLQGYIESSVGSWTYETSGGDYLAYRDNSNTYTDVNGELGDAGLVYWGWNVDVNSFYENVTAVNLNARRISGTFTENVFSIQDYISAGMTIPDSTLPLTVTMNNAHWLWKAKALPTVTTSMVSDITSTSVVCGGNVTYSGGATVTERGVCWSSNSSLPTVNDSHTSDGYGVGEFTSLITGLEEGISYYVRAYATNNAGTAYGESVLFVPSVDVVDETGQPCPGTPTVTDYDGNVYNTVQIGQQCWMKENLRTTHYSDGSTILTSGNTVSETAPYYYDNLSGGSINIPLSARGYLYNWPAAMHGASSSTSVPSGVQGVCPTGWHLPSDAEWTMMTDYAKSQSEYQCSDDSDYIAKALASTNYWNSYNGECNPGDQSQHANNTSGFSAVPAGDCGMDFDFWFGNLGLYAYFWTSSQLESNSGFSYCHYLHSIHANVFRTFYEVSNGYSVRCLRDAPIGAADTIFLLQEGFETGSLPAGWTTVDSDGDGNNWYVTSGVVHAGDGCVTSASWVNNTVLTPDNWLITPAVELFGVDTLSFWVAGQDPNYAAEHFSVYLSTTGTAISDFTTTLLYDQVSTPTMTQYTVDLSPYSGQTVYIAFRHHNVTDMFRLNLDDVEIYTYSVGPTTQGGVSDHPHPHP